MISAIGVLDDFDWPLGERHLDNGIAEFVTSGYVRRDGSCVLCAQAPPVDWMALLHMAESAASGRDYIRVDLVVIKNGRPVVNEITLTWAAVIVFHPGTARELARR